MLPLCSFKISFDAFVEADLWFAELRCEINDEDNDELDPGPDRWMMMLHNNIIFLIICLMIWFSSKWMSKSIWRISFVKRRRIHSGCLLVLFSPPNNTCTHYISSVSSGNRSYCVLAESLVVLWLVAYPVHNLSWCAICSIRLLEIYPNGVFSKLFLQCKRCQSFVAGGFCQ